MEKWLESVYSDGSSYFVSNPEPELGEEVAVRIRMYDDGIWRRRKSTRWNTALHIMRPSSK